MAMNVFAPYPKINGCFIVRSLLPSRNSPQYYNSKSKTIRIFNYPIPAGMERDILAIPGVSESDIRASLLKGELRTKILVGEIEVVCSDIDLLQFNQNQKTFLQNAGIQNGLDIGVSELDPFISLPTNDPYKYYQDVHLIGAVNDVNTIFTIPEGVFYYDVDHKFILYLNGIKQNFMDDFYIAESNGPGSGYNTIIFTEPPHTTPTPIDVVTADYYIYTG